MAKRVVNRDTLEPSNAYKAAHVGWGIDRRRPRQPRDERNLDTLRSLATHSSQRWWHRRGGTGWEMGPDSDITCDSQVTSKLPEFSRWRRHQTPGYLRK